MRSRILLCVGAWTLGTACATAGSVIAVGQLGDGLLAPQSKPVAVAIVNSELALENTERTLWSPTPAPLSSPADSPAQAAGSHSHSPAPTPNPVRLLTSSDGSVGAACEEGGAYLAYWSPQQGFEADDVVRGPLAVAAVTFRSSSGGLVMKVTCRAGIPVEHLTQLQWGGGSGHDE